MAFRIVVTSLVFAVVAGLSGASIAAAHSSAPSPGAAVVQQASAKCTTTGYSMNCTGCVKISKVGTFTVKVQHTSVAVRGNGSSRSAGTTVCLAKVPTPVKSKGGVGVRVTATGSFGPLHVQGKHPKVFSYNVKTKALKTVKTISRAGIFQVIV